MPDYVVIPVFYATDRKPVMPLLEWKGKLREKGSDYVYYGQDWGELEFGLSRVSIPTQTHQTGEIERPKKWRLEFQESLEKHFTIITLDPMSSEQFFGRVQTTARASSQRDAFIFIHGYNVKFSEALMRTAQLAFDLDFKGAAVLYSWPSAGSEEEYPKDEETIRLTEDHLQAFLQQFVRESGAGKVHLIAHSMGNRALTEVLKSFVTSTSTPTFNEVILAAPDVNRELFVRRIAPAINAARRLTLYASSDDTPLKLSRRFHQYARAGESGPNLVLLRGIETIDASGIDTDFMAHSYFANTRRLLNDISLVFHRSFTPPQRGLTLATGRDINYWTVR